MSYSRVLLLPVVSFSLCFAAHATEETATAVPAPAKGDSRVQPEPPGRVVLLERFNRGLEGWVLDQTGGTVRVVTQDFSAKLELRDISSGGAVCAAREVAEPAGTWILEYDAMMAAAGDRLTMDLVGSDGRVVASVDHGSEPDMVAFATDGGGAQPLSWNHGTYKQVVLVVNPEQCVIAGYLSGGNHTYSSLDRFGPARPYSGRRITRLRFRTHAAATLAYIDEVRVYTPNLFIIGDSISDGKPQWSTHPAYPTGRMSARSDETSSPSYQLSRMYPNEWVANRGFGGTSLSGVNAKIQSVVLDHGAKRVIVSVGHNDIYPGRQDLVTMQKLMNSILAKIHGAGLSGKDVVLCSVTPSRMIDTPAERALRDAYNAWLAQRAEQTGAAFADVYAAVRAPDDPHAIARAYDVGDGVHFNKAGNGVIAAAIRDAR